LSSIISFSFGGFVDESDAEFKVILGFDNLLYYSVNANIGKLLIRDSRIYSEKKVFELLT
jgi:hypothetical protein